jgi:secreted protein with Ig-like and vWFA domain
VTTRYVRIQLEQAVYERARQAAKDDRRSLSNWLAVTVERSLEDRPSDAAEQPAQTALFQLV